MGVDSNKSHIYTKLMIFFVIINAGGWRDENALMWWNKDYFHILRVLSELTVYASRFL